MNRGGPLRPKQGPKMKLSPECEKDMSQYLEECWEFGMLKTKDEFKNEIVHYITCYKIPNTFPNTKLGDEEVHVEK